MKTLFGVLLLAIAAAVISFPAMAGMPARDGGGDVPPPQVDAAGLTLDAFDLSTPEAAAEAFFEIVFTSADITPALDIICSTIDFSAQEMIDSLASMQQMLTDTGATLDISGMTYEAIYDDDNRATVYIGGVMSITVQGVSTEMDFPSTPIPMNLEDGGWKLCG